MGKQEPTWTKIVSVCLSPELKEQWEKRARDERQSLSQWLRSQIQMALNEASQPPSDPFAAQELNSLKARVQELEVANHRLQSEINALRLSKFQRFHEKVWSILTTTRYKKLEDIAFAMGISRDRESLDALYESIMDIGYYDGGIEYKDGHGFKKNPAMKPVVQDLPHLHPPTVRE